MLTRFFKKAGKRRTEYRPAEVVMSEDATEEATVVMDEPFGSCAIHNQNWLPGEIVEERYRIDRIYGGAMGKVYIAQHLTWGIWMAIKAPKSEIWANREGLLRIVREANSWISLGLHPNIASCYYVKSIAGIPHIFIEYVAGGTLEEWINRGRCQDMRTALSIVIQFCNGMEYTHSKGYIHRDIKPQNILLSKDGLVKITDFGILRLINEKSQDEDISLKKGKNKNSTVGFRGTPNYASPEQLRDAHRVDRRTDVYSFGLCMWMIFCGKRPYKNNTQENCPEPEPANPENILPEQLKAILKKSVAYHPENRFQDFVALREALNRVYVDLFQVSCPYAVMGKIDMRAENMNNRAVSLAELGKFEEAASCLDRTLEINDSMPEALYNMYMLQWCKSPESPIRLLRCIEASKKRFPKLSLFDRLEKEIASHIERDKEAQKKGRNKEPQLQLCFPRSPMEIFRDAQLRRSVHHNILALMQNRRLTECYDTLLVSWSNERFKKDKFYYKIYEQLIPEGKKKSLTTVQRMATFPAADNGPISFLAGLAGRKLVFSVSSDTDVYVHSIGAKKRSVLLIEAPKRITALASGQFFLAVGQENGAVRFRCLKTGEQFEVLFGKSSILSLAFNQDGKQILAGLADGSVVLCEIPDGKPTKKVSCGTGVNALAWLQSADFTVACEDGSLRFYNVRSGECRKEVDAHALPVTSLAVAEDGQTIATSSADRLVRIWDCKTGRCELTIDGHDDAVTSVLFLQDGKTLISGGADDIIRLWDRHSGKCNMILDARGDGVTCLATAAKPHTFLSARQDGAIVLWSGIYQLEFDDGFPSALRSS